jgi:hypothetical protein
MQTHTYDLAFRTAKEVRKRHPEIIFIIKEQYLESLYERLAKLNPRYMSFAHTYFDGRCDSFVSPKTDLLGGFGYGDCGYVTIQNEDAWLHIPLRSGNQTLEATYTIHFLSDALLAPFEEERESNRDQQVFLETTADRYRAAGWGHMLGGHVGPSFVMWLKRYGENNKDGPTAPLPPAVLNAMHVTWNSVAGDTLKKYHDEIRGEITPHGRFWMKCFGNACDIAIYPEEHIDESCEYVRFACHNLDWPSQQLTLLAGLAKLCELARQEE